VLGSNSSILFYDGPSTNSPLIEYILGPTSDVPNSVKSSQPNAASLIKRDEGEGKRERKREKE
jgi:hypothetical protein